MTAYNPEVIERFAHRLHARAALAVILSTSLGLLIGATAGPILLQSLPAGIAERCPDWVATVVLGLFGFGQGLERGFLLKVQAQNALCQLQIERNTRPASAPASP